jgi:hypothetical protein
VAHPFDCARSVLEAPLSQEQLAGFLSGALQGQEVLEAVRVAARELEHPPEGLFRQTEGVLDAAAALPPPRCAQGLREPLHGLAFPRRSSTSAARVRRFSRARSSARSRRPS